ncbi:hypothetical protein BpHYR1_018168 [Brachionus plicatilis]|uniref:Uncharacterized protein n=1 Tax=Brachionus plicatilis TaxID=10195 RepID=A0A3M7SHV9_BRAPC|nr:hypothetical protein BpHYR1_018168 [Brachionus plicatilis]
MFRLNFWIKAKSTIKKNSCLCPDCTKCHNRAILAAKKKYSPDGSCYLANLGPNSTNYSDLDSIPVNYIKCADVIFPMSKMHLPIASLPKSIAIHFFARVAERKETIRPGTKFCIPKWYAVFPTLCEAILAICIAQNQNFTLALVLFKTVSIIMRIKRSYI